MNGQIEKTANLAEHAISSAQAEKARHRTEISSLTMKNRVKDFSDTYECIVFCGTWNVCNYTMAESRPSSLKQWLFPSTALEGYADIYAVGFQEIVDLNTRNVVMDGSKSAEKATYWSILLYEILAETGIHYTLILQKHLVGILLIVFVREALFPQISDIRATTTATGLLGIMGNKGCCSIRFRLFDTTLCFLCTHLRHSKEELASRNMEVKEIQERTIFHPTTESVNQMMKGFTPKASNAWRQAEFYESIIVDKHDYIFWIGDLNYRIAAPTDDVFTKVESDSWQNLVWLDQLTMERKKGTVFQGYVEPPIGFLPTYKYQPGTDKFEKRAEKKRRAPAWCDRILFSTKEKIDVIAYNSAKVLVSDHIPVYGLFKISALIVDVLKEMDVYKHTLIMLDSLENDLAPKVELRDRVIDIQDLTMEELPAQRSMLLVNVGQVPAAWSVGLERPLPAWLSMHPMAGSLQAGEVAEIMVLIDVNEVTGADILARPDKVTNPSRFDHIAIVEIHCGNHYFCPISGSLASTAASVTASMNGDNSDLLKSTEANSVVDATRTITNLNSESTR